MLSDPYSVLKEKCFSIVAQTVQLSLKDVLIFTTGSSEIPTMGYQIGNRPMIEFSDQNFPE